MSDSPPRPLLRALAALAIALGVSGFSLADDNGPATRPGQDGERRPRRQADDQQSNRPERGPGQRGGRPGAEMMRVIRAIDALDLTPDQQTKVDALKAESREKMKALREDLQDRPPEEARQRVQEVVGEVRQKLNAILTPEQQAELKKNVAAAPPADGPPPRRKRDGEQRGEKGDEQGPQAEQGDAGENAKPRQQGGQQGRGFAAQRLKQNLAQLDLTADQKTKTDAIVAWAEECVAKMREDTQSDPQQLREHAGNIMRDVQRKLSDVLTPEQQAKMRSLQPRRQADGDGEPGNRRNRDGPPPSPPGDKPSDMNGDPPRVQNESQNNTAPAKAGSVSSSAATATDSKSTVKTVAVGQPAPAFTLLSLDKKTVTPASLRGRPTALIFGSYSSPLFRDKAAGFEKLHQRYRGRANVVIVYTREAYAAGEWDVERNKDAKIEVAQPATLDDRRALARRAADALKLTGDVLVDDIDDAVAVAYAAEQGGCTILDAAGNIVSQQKWPEPFATKIALDALLKR